MFSNPVMNTIRSAATLGVATVLALSFWSGAAARAAVAVDEPAAAQTTMSVGVGRASLVKSPVPAKTVTVIEPKIADVQILSPTQLLITGKMAGSTDVVLFDAQNRAEHIEIAVTADRGPVLTSIRKMFPDAKLDIAQSNDAIVVTGVMNHAEDVERLHKYMDFTGIKYVDMTTLAGVQQVQIKIMIAEASRTAIRSLGVNSFFGGHDFAGGIQPGPDQGGALNPVGIGEGGRPIFPLPVQGATTLFGIVPHSDIAVFIQALAENQYLRVLSEPNLVALSGEEASFLAGGEFPIPVVQGAGATTSGTSLSIEYKKFGVQLRFRPTVTGDGKIRLHVAPEVSELSNVGAVILQGFSVPGLLTRRAETTIELRSGQTFGMAGLISQSTQARSSRVPGLGDLPVLGAMFRSVRYTSGDTELVVLVTAQLVEPLSTAVRPPVPAEFHVAPNDWELYALGRTEGDAQPKISASDAAWLRKSGLSRLRGSGAWATYDGPGAIGTAGTDPIPESAALASPAAAEGAAKSAETAPPPASK
jgi:pilus assembly protein CpaC